MAEVTIFTKSQCGHCTRFKGEKTDSQGHVTRDPNGGVQLLIGDPILKKLGIKVREYKVSSEADPANDVHGSDEFKKTYNAVRTGDNQIRGFPRIEISDRKKVV